MKVRRLECELTPEEIEQHAKALSAAHAEVEDLKEEQSDLKDRIKDAEQAESVILTEIRNRRIYRDVEIEERKDYGRQLIEVFRKDTGDKVDERALTEDDRQENLDLSPNDEPSAVAEDDEEPEANDDTDTEEEA